ncbi:MAG TPA: FAD-binding oxidoreductase [Mycobacteriales bacterium]|nr:FAD-binding oxidoreductase [Mycobacteriales bacterium]
MQPVAPLPDWAAWGTHRPQLSRDAWSFLRAELGPVDPGSRPSAALHAVPVPPARLSAVFRSRLEELVGATALLTDPETRLRHSGGLSYLDLVRRRSGSPAAVPDAVVTPATGDEVESVLAACAEAGVAVVPFGGGTSVVGGVEAFAGRFPAVIALDLRRLDRVVEVDRTSCLAVLEPGLTTPATEAALAEHGLTLGHFPQSYERATLGGYVATRSAGQASTGYGRMDDLVAGLRVATPSGMLHLPAGPGSAAGPDLRRLFLGSEGAFGVITEVTLRVHPAPETRHYEGWTVRSWPAGLAALRRLAQDGPAPDIVRLSDPDETRVGLRLSTAPRLVRSGLSRYMSARVGDQACLVILGFEGRPGEVRHRRRVAAAALRAAGAVRLGTRPGTAWEHGRYAGPYLRDSLLDAGVLAETLETAATWTDLAGLYAGVVAALRASLGPRVLVGCHVSHVYPTGASLYFTVLAAARQGSEAAQWEPAKRAAGDAIVAAGGTITHHHAIGTAHTEWLEAEDGVLGLEILRAVKQRVDPAGIMNPGKLLP